MPLPTPNDGEEESDFMNRCIEWVMENEDDVEDTDQATAMCGDKWDEAKLVDRLEALEDKVSELKQQIKEIQGD